MTPGARVQAAIDLLDEIFAGAPAERALTGWARRSRFAGSKDRAAVRDHVFDALRRWRSCAVLGGGESGRARMIGLLRGEGTDPATLFTGDGHAPAPLSPAEDAAGAPPQGLDALDLPDWLWPLWQDSLGEAAEACAETLRHRPGAQALTCSSDHCVQLGLPRAQRKQRPRSRVGPQQVVA